MFKWDTNAKIITNRQLRICANKTVHQLGTVKLREGSLTALFVLLSWLLSLTRLGRAHGETAAAAAPMRNIVTSDATSLKLIKTYSARGSQGDRSASPHPAAHIVLKTPTVRPKASSKCISCSQCIAADLYQKASRSQTQVWMVH